MSEIFSVTWEQYIVDQYFLSLPLVHLHLFYIHYPNFETFFIHPQKLHTSDIAAKVIKPSPIRTAIHYFNPIYFDYHGSSSFKTPYISVTFLIQAFWWVIVEVDQSTFLCNCESDSKDDNSSS